jgi:hypothetical protein
MYFAGGNMPKILEHIMKGWEIKYGYLHLGPRSHPEAREFFKSVIDKHFTLNVFGKELFERKIDEDNRIYVGREALRDLKAGETVLIIQDEKGNFHVTKKK